MTAEPEDVRMMRLHKAWADRFTILSQIIVLMLFGAFYAILEVTNAAAADRTDTLIRRSSGVEHRHRGSSRRANAGSSSQWSCGHR